MAVLLVGILGFVAIVLFVLLIIAVAFWAFSHIFAQTSGWNDLAAHYAAGRQPVGEQYLHQHSRVGMVRYRNGTTIGISPAGLYLAVTVPFMHANAPLLIPWSAVSAATPSRLYWLSAMQLSIGRPPLTTITVLKGIFDKMQPYLQS